MYENTKVGKVLYPPPIELCRFMVPEGKELVGSARSPSAFLEYLGNSLHAAAKSRKKFASGRKRPQKVCKRPQTAANEL